MEVIGNGKEIVKEECYVDVKRTALLEADLHDFVLVLGKTKTKRFCFDRSKYHCKSKKERFALVLLKTKTKSCWSD